MKKFCLLLSLVFLIIATGFAAAPQFSAEEQKALDRIKQVKEFEKTIGLKKTKNFQKFQEKVPAYNFVYYHPKTVIPFSCVDPKMKYLSYKSDSFFVVPKEIDTSKCNFYFHPYLAMSDGTIFTRNLLHSSRLAETVIHEDFHDNVDLPRHINEAAATLVGLVGGWEFSGLNKEQIQDSLNTWREDLDAVNQCYDELDSLSTLYQSGQIGDSVYSAQKERSVSTCRKQISYGGHFARYSAINATTVSFLHTYAYYFPLMRRLYSAFDGNLEQVVAVMKNLPVHEPQKSPYFEKTREGEKIIEAYLEKIIKEANFLQN